MFNFFVFAARLLLVFASIHLPCCCSVHKSLAPRTRTLLGVLGQATLNFVAVATPSFFFFCVCPKFCDLAKQRRKMFVGVSEVRKIDFALYFLCLCVFFLVLYLLLLRSRDWDHHHHHPPIPLHARGHGACPLGPWVVGRRLCGGVAGSCRRRRPCAWL